MATSFLQHLCRQLRWLKNSAERFDFGHEDESIRLAVILRVLFHNTRRSTSLLAHLNAETIKLEDSAGLPPASAKSWDGLTLLTFNGLRPRCYAAKPGFRETCAFSLAIGVADANLEQAREAGVVPFHDWWNSPVYIIDKVAITRRSLCLIAANKDGGAHVDAMLPSEYESLSEGGFVLTTPEGSRKLTNAHFVGLRQIVYEVLNSSELIALAKNA